MAKVIALGTTVTDAHGSIYSYAGPAKYEGGFSVRIALFSGKVSEVCTAPESLIPTSELNLNTKDARIDVVKNLAEAKLKSEAWQSTIRDEEGNVLKTFWTKNKKSGVERSAHLIAIRDWHNA